MINEELQKIKGEVGEDRYQNGKFPEASKMFDGLVASDTLCEFLTLPAYAAMA